MKDIDPRFVVGVLIVLVLAICYMMVAGYVKEDVHLEYVRETGRTAYCHCVVAGWIWPIVQPFRSGKYLYRSLQE